MEQFQCGIFYGWTKLKSIEILNLSWIAECISQSMKARIHEYIQIA